MIVMGYPAIGKTTLAEKSLEFIDLEATSFFVQRSTKNGYKTDREEYWYKVYGNMAIDLHKQGYTVLISSNQKVRQYLIECKSQSIITEADKICILYPSLKLKNYWITKVKKRYIAENNLKNERAYLRVSNYFEQDIRDLSASPFINIEITDRYYDLEYLINQVKEQS